MGMVPGWGCSCDEDAPGMRMFLGWGCSRDGDAPGMKRSQVGMLPDWGCSCTGDAPRGGSAPGVQVPPQWAISQGRDASWEACTSTHGAGHRRGRGPAAAWPPRAAIIIGRRWEEPGDTTRPWQKGLRARGSHPGAGLEWVFITQAGFFWGVTGLSPCRGAEQTPVNNGRSHPSAERGGDARGTASRTDRISAAAAGK